MTAPPRRGANAIEFALTLPIFVALTLGGLEVAWLYHLDSSMNQAVTAACRTGSMIDPGVDESELPALLLATRQRMTQQLSRAGVGACETGCVPTARVVGRPEARSLVCELTWVREPLVGFLGNRVTMNASTTNRLEWQR